MSDKARNRMIREQLGLLIYGIARIYDENLVDILIDVRENLGKVDHPCELF